MGTDVVLFPSRQNTIDVHDAFLEDAGYLENQVFVSATVSVRF